MQEGRKGNYEPQRIPRLFESKRVYCVSRVSADQSQRGMTCGVAYLSKMNKPGLLLATLFCNRKINSALRINDQGSTAIHHSTTKAQSGRMKENGLYIVFGGPFFVLFWTSKKEQAI